MKRSVVVWSALALLLAPTIAAAPAGAERSHGRPVAHAHRGGFAHGHVRSAAHPVSHPSRQFGRHFPHRHAGPGRAVGSVFYVGAPVYETAPAYYDPFTYAAPPVTYAPPVAYAPPDSRISLAPAPPPSAPTPNVIEYPNGRYELQGDGVRIPYTWVWIPNPPPPPPAAPPPDPPTSQAPAPSRAVDRPLYRWSDDQGVVHWTDRWSAVPEHYRSQVTRFPSG
jgi:hypothetical protein